MALFEDARHASFTICRCGRISDAQDRPEPSCRYLRKLLADQRIALACDAITRATTLGVTDQHGGGDPDEVCRGKFASVRAGPGSRAVLRCYSDLQF
jgi:hypothetical protein